MNTTIQNNYRSTVEFNTGAKLFFTLLLFVYLFAPPILPSINIIFVLGVISTIYVIAFYKEYVWKLLQENKYSVSIFCVCVIYMMVLSLLNSLKNDYLYSTIKNVYRFLLIFPLGYSNAFLIVIWLRKYKLSFEQLLELLLFAGSLQGVISISMMLSPSIKRLLVSVMYKNTGDIKMLNAWHYDRRYFGFANNLYDTFGLGIAALLIIATLLSIFWKRRCLIHLPFLLIAGVGNSRTSIILYMIFLLLLFIYFVPRIIKFIKDGKISLSRILIIVLLIVFISFLALLLLKLISRPTFDWLISGIKSIFILIVSLLKGKPIKNDSLGQLFSKDFWNLPENAWYLLFGTGHDIYLYPGVPHSDVGYVNDVWLMGLFSTILFYTNYGISTYTVFQRKKSELTLLLFISFILLFIFFNIKSMFFTFNSGLAAIIYVKVASDFRDDLVKTKEIK